MDKKIVILFYEHVNREYEACLRIKKEIESTNKDIKVYVYSIVFEYRNSLILNQKNKIDMVIMPWVYCDDGYRYTQPFLEKNEELLIVNLHHEQIYTKIAEHVLLPTGENAKNSVIHFTWADNFSEKLLEHGVNSNLIFQTGHIRNGKVAIVNITKEELANEFQLDKNKKWILFCENRGWVLLYREEHKNTRLRLGFHEDELNGYYETFKKSIERTVEEFNEISDNFFEEYELIYRPHPGTGVPKNMNSRIKVIGKYPVPTWFKVIDVNVSFSSTTIFESDSRGIPSFAYEPIPYDDKYKIIGLKNYQKIFRFEDINDEIVKYYHEHIKNQKIYESYIGNVERNPIKITSETVIKILSNRIPGYKANLIPYRHDKVRGIKRREFITNILVRLNLLEILKWPYRSYDLRNDLPYCNKVVTKIEKDIQIKNI